MTAEVMRMHTIQRVMNEFLDWRAPSLHPEELLTYGETIALFEGSINAHASSTLDASERAPTVAEMEAAVDELGALASSDQQDSANF